MNLNDYEEKIFSQNGEDGIIKKFLELFYYETILVGPSNSRIKKVPNTFKEPALQICTSSPFPDKFGFGVDKNTITISRTDNPGIWGDGWGQNLKLYSGNSDDKFFVEFGTQSGDECNARILREHFGWNGLFMDGGHENLAINLHKEFITKENIIGLFQKYNVPKKFELLSIDIDSTDFYVLHQILKEYTIDILICEYNADYLAHEDKVIIYKPDQVWSHDNYFGASLLAFNNLCTKFGYTLVGCDNTAVNCFFIKTDLLKEKNINIRDAGNVDKLYKPARYGGGPNGGHVQDRHFRKHITSGEAMKFGDS